MKMLIDKLVRVNSTDKKSFWFGFIEKQDNNFIHLRRDKDNKIVLINIADIQSIFEVDNVNREVNENGTRDNKY